MIEDITYSQNIYIDATRLFIEDNTSNFEVTIISMSVGLMILEFIIVLVQMNIQILRPIKDLTNHI